MKRSFPQRLFLILILSLAVTSCKFNKESEHHNDTKSDTLTENIITKNEGKYPKDIEIFGQNNFARRFKQLAGENYKEIKSNFQTQTPIVSDKGIYKFTGCKQHDCPSFLTTVLYNAHTDNLNILINRNGRVKVLDEKGKIVLSNDLESK